MNTNTNSSVSSSDDIECFDSTQTASWSSVIAMSVCAFVLVASEFLPVSLLTPMAASLHVTEGMAGQGIMISGVFAVVTSLSISALAGRLDRKILLLGLTAAMGLSGAIIAWSPNYFTYMFGRALIGVVVGGFWSMSAAIAIRLVPEDQVPRAIAIFNGGNALASVVAAPLGAYLGIVIGWRGAFFCLVPISLITLAWLWVSLPEMPVIAQVKRSNYLGYLMGFFTQRIVSLGMLAGSLFFMGQFALFTYIRPFLENITHVEVPVMSLILLFTGISGCIGTFLIGKALARGFYQTLCSISGVMAAIALALLIFGHITAIVVVLLGLWGLFATAAPTGWWAWIAKTFSTEPETGGSLFVAVVQVAIALGSTVGGYLFDHLGYQGAFVASAVLLLISAGLTVMTARSAPY